MRGEALPRKTISAEMVPGDEPDSLALKFRGCDGAEAGGACFELTAGTVGTWELTVTVGAAVPPGGGFLFQRRGFLLGHRTQDYNPLGRDFVTLETKSDAKLQLVVNTANQSHVPSFAQVKVVGGTLKPGDRLTLRIGDRCGGGPGSEVYDTTTVGRLYAAADRDGRGTFRSLQSSPVRITITSEPKADQLRLLGPSLVVTNESFDLHLIAFDRHRNLCEAYDGQVQLDAPEGLEGVPETVSFGAGDRGIRILSNLRATRPGVYRIEAGDQPRGLVALGNPIVCRDEPGEKLLWGDLHSHGWGDTSIALLDEPSFKISPGARHDQARRVARLDFAAPGPMSPPIRGERPEVWDSYRQAFRDNDEPGNYVPFLAAEVHTRDGGDRNVIYRDLEEDHLPTFSPMTTLLEAYGQREDVLLESHVGGGPPRWENRPTAKEPLLEIASGHGAFEWLLQEALAWGYRPAVIGSGDTHLPGLGHPMSAHSFRGRFDKELNIRDTGFGSGPVAAVWAAACERGSIWDAIANRRTYATTGARIILSLTVNGHPAGSEVELPGAADIHVRANACADIQRIDLIRGDRCLRSWFPGALDVELRFTDERPLREGAYYLRLRQTDGEYAWSTPVWVLSSGGPAEADPSLPLWNAHEPVDLASLRPNAAETHETALRRYLEVEEDLSTFSELTPVGLLDEVTGRSALFYAYIGSQGVPVSIRWYYEFEMPRIHLDWGWRDFGVRSEIGYPAYPPQ